ncbi:ABC transporter ATP-binding protein [Bifidobacterium pseudocatenulatum]|uniref:ABC transporter ATP-binding protein n=1 Tax=Bifidobacterium pseudocatenulatum TaxID=28026 RepID=UPI003219191C
MTLADQKATIARTSEAFVNANPSAETVTRAAREVLNDSAERGGGVQMLNVDKIYPGATNKALDNFNLEINPGEMVVLLGGSGCGKSTALRSLAGLEDIQAGRILVGGQDVTGVPVNKRNMAMVFQAYSLFPHMTALQNVEFGLEIRRIQLEAGTTTVFVTHDQEEALTVADRIGVMNHGCIEQIADPQTLYRRPGSEYVATFIGLTNRLPGITNGEEAVVFGQRVPLLEASKRDASTVLVRPENLVITLAANDGNMVGEHGRVDMVHFLGALARVDLTVAAGVGHLPVTVQLPANELPAGLTVGSEVVVAPRPIAALAV